eukprot:5642778-Prymnesium_polylepis.1
MSGQSVHEQPLSSPPPHLAVIEPGVSWRSSSSSSTESSAPAALLEVELSDGPVWMEDPAEVKRRSQSCSELGRPP